MVEAAAAAVVVVELVVVGNVVVNVLEAAEVDDRRLVARLQSTQHGASRQRWTLQVRVMVVWRVETWIWRHLCQD